MIIDRIESGQDTGAIADAIICWMLQSRFRAEVKAFRTRVKITGVLLRRSKLYCGNHPKACERLFHGKHRKLAFLEGADWVEFNDAINDILDRMGVECRFYSSIVVIRKGRRRRARYDADSQLPDGTWQWNKDGPDDHYEDRCGVDDSAPSQFPFGTPGIHEPLEYFCVGAHDHDHD